jgi:hypothetical protein
MAEDGVGFNDGHGTRMMHTVVNVRKSACDENITRMRILSLEKLEKDQYTLNFKTIQIFHTSKQSFGTTTPKG